MKSMFISLVLLLGTAGATNASSLHVKVTARTSGVADGIYGVTNAAHSAGRTALIFVGEAGEAVAQKAGKTFNAATQMAVVTGTQATELVMSHLSQAVETTYGYVISAKDFTTDVLSQMASILDSIVGIIWPFDEPRSDASLASAPRGIRSIGDHVQGAVAFITFPFCMLFTGGDILECL